MQTDEASLVSFCGSLLVFSVLVPVLYSRCMFQTRFCSAEFCCTRCNRIETGLVFLLIRLLILVPLFFLFWRPGRLRQLAYNEVACR